MSDTSEPIAFRRPAHAPTGAPGGRQSNTTKTPGASSVLAAGSSGQKDSSLVVFDRRELNQLFSVYGRRVAAGEWRDYAIDWGRESAVFSIFRRASEVPIYRVVKAPKLARRQGAYSIVSATGLILKRGHELSRVLDVLDQRLSVVT